MALAWMASTLARLSHAIADILPLPATAELPSWGLHTARPGLPMPVPYMVKLSPNSMIRPAPMVGISAS